MLTDSKFSEIQETLEEHEEQLEERRLDIRELRVEIEALKDALKENTAASRDLIEVYTGLKSFLQVLGWIERVSVFIAKVAVALGLIWATFKFGVLEILSRGKQ